MSPNHKPEGKPTGPDSSIGQPKPAIDIPETDNRTVALEIIREVKHRQMHFSGELEEFLDARENTAPATAAQARVLDSVIRHEVRQWLDRRVG